MKHKAGNIDTFGAGVTHVAENLYLTLKFRVGAHQSIPDPLQPFVGRQAGHNLGAHVNFAHPLTPLLQYLEQVMEILTRRGPVVDCQCIVGFHQVIVTLSLG